MPRSIYTERGRRPERPVFDTEPLDDAEQRVLYAEATRVKSGEVEHVLVTRDGRGVKVRAYTKAT